MKKLILSITMIAVAAFIMTSCGGGAEQTAPTADTTAVAPAPEAALDLTAGKTVYDAKCKVCHMETGLGMAPAFPPLDASDYLLADVPRAIKQLKSGATAPVMVNGTEYKNGAMKPAIGDLTDQQILDVMNYVLNSWSNKHGLITMEEVTAALAK
jgi:nitrite reductase (NO-forming)